MKVGVTYHIVSNTFFRSARHEKPSKQFALLSVWTEFLFAIKTEFRMVGYHGGPSPRLKVRIWPQDG